MQLPFTEAEFLEVFGQYNRALWPGAVVLWLASTGVAVDWLGARRLSDRWLAGFLAFHWAWVGVFYHGVYFSRINPAAWLFAALFLAQAALLLWFGCHRRSLTFTARSGAWRGVGCALVVYSLVYPVLPWALGFRYPETPTFGLPCPTTLLTAGFLVASSSPALRRLLVVPAVWCLIGGSAAFLFGVYPDWALLLALPVLMVRGLARRSSTDQAPVMTAATLPEPWRLVAEVAVGGLYAIGFIPGADHILVVSSQGRGLYSASSGRWVARDRDDSWAWYDDTRLLADAIGPYDGRSVPVAGVDGGRLATETADGWSLSSTRGGRLGLTSPDGVESEVAPRWPGEPLRAFGFSSGGDSFAVAVGSHTLELYSRRGRKRNE